MIETFYFLVKSIFSFCNIELNILPPLRCLPTLLLIYKDGKTTTGSPATQILNLSAEPYIQKKNPAVIGRVLFEYTY